MTDIFDSHAHYDDEAFDPDRDALLSGLSDRGVCGVINAAVDLPSAAAGAALSQRYPFVYAAAGVHPQQAAGADIETLERDFSPYWRQEKTVAIGEIGLDYHYEDACPREKQLAVFEAQLQLAVKWDLPVIVHDREAHADTVRLLRQYRPRGVVHCFSGSVETMREVLAVGLYIGLGGAVTFKGAKHPALVAAAVPADRLLLETDAPYMAPTPYRGRRCDSSLIAVTAQHIAQLRCVPTETLLHETAENARRLFDIGH